jgi:hypothetical protein
MASSTSPVSQIITAVTLNVTSAGTPATVSQTFNDPATLASLKLGQNSLPITNQAILGRYTTPGLQCSNTLSVEYTGYMDVNSVAVSTPALVNDFVATPITLSNFGPFTRDFVSNGTFTLPQPSSNSNSPGTFSYSVPNNNGVVSISGNVVTMLAAGSTTITAIQAAAGGYASSTPITASFVIIPIAPTFSNNNSSTFTIPNKNVGDAAFMPSYPISNSLGAFTYTSNNQSVATVNATGLVTIVGQGTATITALQAAYGGYTSRPATGNVTVSIILQEKGFSQVTDSAFTNLNFDSGMTQLFSLVDSTNVPINMPNNSFKFNAIPYSVVYLSSEGALYFGTRQNEYNYGTSNQIPVNSFRFFGYDHMSTGSYKFDSNNTKLLIKLTGFKFYDELYSFTIKVIIEQSGNITTNYTLASTYTSDLIIIGYVGSNSNTTSDDIFLTLGGVTFNGTTYINLFSLLNGKTILYIPVVLPNVGPFTLPTDINVYKNQTITRQLTPPTTNSSGAFTYTSSNLAVATITSSNGVFSINVIGLGTSTITAIQAASGEFSSSSSTTTLVVTGLYPIFGPFTSLYGLQFNNTPISRALTPPSSNSSGTFTYTSLNTAVANITTPPPSINVVGSGNVIVLASQAASGDYSIATQGALLNTVTGMVIGFYEVTNSAFTNLNFNSGMTSLFSYSYNLDNQPINMPNTNFTFNGTPYSVMYLSSSGTICFEPQNDFNVGTYNQLPVNSFRFFSYHHVSSCSYKFDSNNTRLLVKFTGYNIFKSEATFAINLIIEQSGFITINYTIASTYNSDRAIIGYVGSNSSTGTDDVFLNLGGVVFNGNTNVNLFSILNGKTIQYYNNLILPNLGPFTLPSGINVYQYPPVSWVLTPPTSDNTSGAFTFSSSNLNVATISNIGQGLSSITVVGPGTTIITATQAISNGYSGSSVSVTLVVTAQIPSWTEPFSLPSDLNVYQGQPITRTLTIPTPSTSSSLGSFTVSSNNLSVATINNNVPNGPTITVVGPGTCVITATQNPSGPYYSLSQSVTLTIFSTHLYSVSSPPPMAVLSGFPTLGAMTKWEMDIVFNVTGGNNTLRPIIGDMYNQINTIGWGVWVSPSNGIQFSWNNVNVIWDTLSASVALNTDYNLKLTRTPTSLTVVLTNIASNVSQTAVNTQMSDTQVYVMSVNGPIITGGWLNNSKETFIGTISSVKVINPDGDVATSTTSYLLARYDASVASNYTLSGGNVTQWNDLTGQGNNLIANVTGPTLTTINSAPAFNFNPGFGLTCASVNLASQITVFMVVTYKNTIASWGNFMHHADRDMDWSFERNNWNDGTFNIQFQSNNDNSSIQTVLVEANKNYIFVGRTVGTTRKLWVYSDTLVPKSVSTFIPVVSITPGNKPLYVGKSDIGEGCNSNIGEILYYSASLSDDDVAQNVSYLQNKWFNYKQSIL